MHHLSSFSSFKLFAPSAPLPLKQFSSIIERLTYTATCKLFLPPAQFTLRHISHASEAESNIHSTPPPNPILTFPSDDRSRAEIASMLMMCQLAMLESIGHKDGVRKVMGCVLEDLLSVYDASWAPIQRARVL